MKREIRIIIADTNWWISLIIKKFNNQFASILPFTNLKFVSSDELTEEIRNTLLKERLQKHLDNETTRRFWQLYEELVTTIQVHSVISICRDPADNFLLSLAKDSKADFLITGDKDLLELHQFDTTIICSLSDFIEKYLPK